MVYVCRGVYVCMFDVIHKGLCAGVIDLGRIPSVA